MGTRKTDETRLTEQNVSSWDDEKPGHLAILDYEYQIMQYLVTNAEFRAFIDDHGYDLEQRGQYWSADGKGWRTGTWQADLRVYGEEYREAFEKWLAGRPVERRSRPFFWDDPAWNAPNLPVVGVTWFEAEAYAAWLTARLRAAGRLAEDHCLRLPGEAEWEKAARGGQGRLFPWGDAWDAARCNNAEPDDRLGRTSPIGTYPHGATPEGVQDLAGNVWEWCRDWYDPGEYERRVKTGLPVINPPGAGSRQARVVRGGSWNNFRGFARCASRGRSGPSGFDHGLGFRLVLSPSRF
jgi:formylglycine-generating enzyme required for sulfatase activity